MKTSVIRQRVADFLKQHHPFDVLSEADLLALAGSGKVKFCESEEYLFHQGDPKGQFLWVIQQGSVELLEEGAGGERLRDVLSDGDLLGLEQFLGDGASLFAARTATDVILYGVAASEFEPLPARYPALQTFLQARFSISGSLGVNRTSWLNAEPPPAGFLRGRLATLPHTATVADAACRLRNAHSGALALVDAQGAPVAALTATQLAGAAPGAATAVALPCPSTLPETFTTRAAVGALLDSPAELLAITADGTPSSPLRALVTARELALFCGHDPTAILDGIRRAGSDAEIIALLPQVSRVMLAALADPRDIDDCTTIAGHLVAALAEACIRLTGEELRAAGLTAPAVPFCWVLFGSAARGDLLQAELPTIAAIYDDTHPAFRPTDSFYFAALAGETASRFHSCGIDGPGADWPERAQPSMPLSEWKRFFTEAISGPLGHNLYTRREFFDCRPFAGHPEILRELQEHILHKLNEAKSTIPLLANDTLVNLPPLTFFRGRVLELNGAHSESFDITKSVVSPIADAARVFALDKGRLTPCNTLTRLSEARHAFPDGAAILAEAADAYRIGLYYQALAGDCRIHPNKLGKFDRVLLKNAFAFIHRFLEFTVSQFLPAS
jgi:CBS domain-containing protein